MQLVYDQIDCVPQCDMYITFPIGILTMSKCFKISLKMFGRCFVMRSRLQVSARHGEHAIRSVPVQVAHELINAGHHCLDVRSALSTHLRGD